MSIPQPNFRPAFNITRASHVVLGVKDIPASKAFYVDTLGFVVSGEDSSRLYLRGLEEACFHSLVLEKSEVPLCSRVGFRVLTNEDLDLAYNHFSKAGFPTRWVTVAHQGRTFHTMDAASTPLEFCANMDRQPRLILSASKFKGGSPQRLDHVQIITPDVRKALSFYMDMGFRLSEYITADGSEEPAFVFLQRKGNPHDIVFAHGAGPRLHHAAFTVPEAYHLMFVCDQLAENGYGKSVEYGPNRHFGPGYARFVYFRDPDGHRIEFFNTHYQTIDSEDEPIKFEFSQLLASGWGSRPPDSWLNDASHFEGISVKEPERGVSMKQHIEGGADR